MTTTTDDLRRALAERAAAIDVPAAAPVGALRQRARLQRLRTLTTVAAALLLVTGLVTVLRNSSSSPSTVDSRLGGSPSTTETTTSPVTVPGAVVPSGQASSSGAGPRQLPTTTTATIPPKVGPIGVGNTPPTTRAAGEPTFAIAQPGNWWYSIAAHQEPAGKDALGRETSPDHTWGDAYLNVRPADGRRQRTRPSSFPYVTVLGAVRTLGPNVTLEELTLWDGREDSERVFRLPAGAYEVPAKDDWDDPWSYEATSTDGTTHLAVRSRVTDPRDVVWLEDGQYRSSYYAIKIESVIDVSGDRSSHIERTVWWATDLGVAAQIREVETATTSKGTTMQRTVTATLRQTTASPESVNRQAVPDDDSDGVPDAADDTEDP